MNALRDFAETQTAKYGREVDEAHQPVAKIRTNPYEAGPKSAPEHKIEAKNPHQPTLLSDNFRTTNRTEINNGLFIHT